MNSVLSIDATQWVGVVSFGTACGACWRATSLRRDPWRALAGVHLALAAEVVLGTRYLLHDAADAALRALGWYPGRAGLQFALLALLFTPVFLIAGWATWRHAHGARGRLAGRPAVAATFATAAAVWVFAVEIVSLHGVDAAMYMGLGSFKVIALLWVAPASWVVGAAVQSTRWRGNDTPIAPKRR